MTKMHMRTIIAFGPKNEVPLQTASRLAVKLFDGKTMIVWHYEPLALAPSAVLIRIHGGPEVQERPTYSPITQFYVNRGVHVYAPNVRGSTGFGRVYQKAIYGRWGRDDVRDIDSLVRQIRSSPLMKNLPVILEGASYGGFLALAAAAASSEPVGGVIARWPVTDLVSFVRDSPGSWRKNLESLVGPIDSEDERLRLSAVSPLSLVHKIRCPVLISHGTNDGRISVRQSEAFSSALTEAGGTVISAIFEGEGHGAFSSADSREILTSPESNFLDVFSRRTL